MATYSVSIDKQPGGEIYLKSNFSEDIVLTSSGQEKVIKVNNISRLEELTDLTTTFTGENNTRKLKMQYRIALSNEPTKFTEWITIDPNSNTDDCFIDLSPFYDYNIEIKFIRTGGNTTGNLTISSFVWEGTWGANFITEPILDLTPSISPVILDVPDIYKIFNLTGYELVARDNISSLDIEYRISQDNKRSWSEWTPLTTSNITTEKIDPIRFFNIQYKFIHTGSSGTIKIRDLNLYGSFINVTQNYSKSNMMGLREDCANGVVGNTGLNGGTGSNNLSMGTNLKSEPSVWSNLDKSKDNLFNPYKLDTAVDMFNELANQATALGGWKVDYYRVEPDENGIDYTIHEYSLRNVVAEGQIKILVPDNQMPTGQVQFNQFDLGLLESFEVHLTKQEFKTVFGAEKRPRKEDFLYFCDLSQMYKITHAQAIRDFANSEVYYKLILDKYHEKADINYEDSDIQEKVDSILNNSTFDDLFSTQKANDKKEVANKKQQETLSQQKIRKTLVAPIEKDLIENAELILSKYHYNLSKVTPGNVAVTYNDSDNYLQEGNNRSFIAWFKLLDYADSDTYNLMSNYSIDLEKGYKFDIVNGNLQTTMNSSTYSLDVSDHLDDNIWYAVLINIDQRQKKIKQHLYKRNVDVEERAKSLRSTELKLLASSELDYTPSSFEIDYSSVSLQITASNMLITNLRIFNDIIPDTEITSVMNQQIIRDTDYAILVDNSNVTFALPNYPYI
jgi:hypothetical protein